MLKAHWLLLLALACDAESLGVEVPRGGPDAMEPATIKRDLWRMTDPRIGGRVPGSSGARRVSQYVAERFQRIGLQPAFKNGYRHDLGSMTGEMVCGVRRGAWDQAILISALDPGIGTLSAIPVAGLISLSSGFVSPDAPMHSLYFCVLPEAGGFAGFPARSPIPSGQLLDAFLIGTLTGDALDESSGPVIGPIQSHLLHSGPLPSDVSQDLGQLNYQKIRARLADIHSRVSSVD